MNYKQYMNERFLQKELYEIGLISHVEYVCNVDKAKYLYHQYRNLCKNK